MTTSCESAPKPAWESEAAGMSLAPQKGADMPHIRLTPGRITWTSKTPPLPHPPPAVMRMMLTGEVGLVVSRLMRLHLHPLTSRLPNSGPYRREAPGGQSNADLHPTRGDCTPLPLSCHLQVRSAWCPPSMTRCRLPHGQRHSEALTSTQTRLRVAKGEGSRFLLVCVCVRVQ